MKCRITEGVSPIITLEIDDEVMPPCSKIAEEKNPLFPIGIGRGVIGTFIVSCILVITCIIWFCVKDVHALKIDLGTMPLSVKVAHSNPDLLCLVVTCCVAALSLVFCTLLCHVRAKMMQERRRALKDRYDFVSQLFNTIKDMKPFPPWMAGNDLRGKAGPMPDKTKTVHDTKDVGKKTTEGVAEAKDTESDEKEVEEETAGTRDAEDESKKDTPLGSEAGDSQSEVFSFIMNGGGGRSPWENGTYMGTGALSSVCPTRPQYFSPQCFPNVMTIIRTSQFGVPGEPDSPLSYMKYEDQ